jgi:ATP-binding cassette subfamily B protein
MSTIQKLNRLLNSRDKRFLLFLILFSIVISMVETAGVSVIMPFIAVATDFSVIHSNKYYSAIYNWGGFANDIEFAIGFGVALLVFYLVRAILNLLYFNMMARFSQGRYYAIATQLFKKYIDYYYVDYVGKNSSILTKTIITEASLLVAVIANVLLMVSETFIIVFLYAMMLWAHWKVTLLFTAVLLVKIGFLGKFLSKKIKAIGKNRVKAQEKLYTLLNSTFGNFKFIKLQPQQNGVCREFAAASRSYTQANITNATIGHFPRLFLELSGFGLIVLMVIYAVWRQRGDVGHIIPVMSLFVLALYRLLPSVNRIMTAYNAILYQHKAVDIVIADLVAASESLGGDNLYFKKSINIKNVCFSYPNQKAVLKNIDLTIRCGEKIGFKGESGAGKTTLVDLIMGLYTPTEGSIEVDNQILAENNLRSWRAKIGYIPQQVYLFDGTVAENVVFGKVYDRERLVETLKQANIYDFLEKKQGLETKVGEGGIQLSGGQKQRIAIARALYSNPEILVLDEATSALDNETEARIMDEIYKIGVDKTLLIIAHRLTTIERCEKVYTLVDGRLAETAQPCRNRV